MRPVATRRLPTFLIILFALIGIAVSVAIGRAIAPGVSETSTGNRTQGTAIVADLRAP
jgi:hypothetical protein